jgi:hypothetical protein
LARLEKLLRLLENAFGAATSGSMDSAPITIRDREATEAAKLLAVGE